MKGDCGAAGSELEKIRKALLDMEDAFIRLKHLCKIGALAADGMHGVGEDPHASAFSTYFCLLSESIDKLQRINPGPTPEVK